MGADDNDSQQVHVRVEHRDSPNLAKLARALITLAQTETRREQAAQKAAENEDEQQGDRAGEEAA